VTGHLDPLAGRDPFVVDGAFVGGGTSWGLVLRDVDEAGAASGAFQRVCEEATGGAALLTHRLPDGRVVVATSNGMVESDDGGCSWRPVASVLANLEVSALVVAHDAPLTVYLSTSRAGAPNGVWKSVDGGATFQETALAGTIHPLIDLAVSDDGSALAVSGFDLDADAPLLRASIDGGASFVSPTFAGINEGEILGVRVLAVDTRVWLAVFTAGSPKIMSADLALTALRDEGAFETDAVAVVPFAGTHYALVRPGALYRRDVVDGSWTSIAGITPSCLRRVAGDARLWACTVAPAQFAVSEDGAAFTPVLTPDEVDERVCPADTFAAQVCVYAPIDVDDAIGSIGFADAAPLVEAPIDEPPAIDARNPPDDNDDHGCSGAGVPLAFVLTLIVVRRRACYA
jgi:hypothetical protein